MKTKFQMSTENSGNGRSQKLASNGKPVKGVFLVQGSKGVEYSIQLTETDRAAVRTRQQPRCSYSMIIFDIIFAASTLTFSNYLKLRIQLSEADFHALPFWTTSFCGRLEKSFKMSIFVKKDSGL